ncbi:hypothetical protein A2U01_0068927, partial [Trifolium medium]|nr:hypothetical protein [Trifolium medium]
MAIPSKGNAPAAAGGGVVEAVQPSPKKRKPLPAIKGEFWASLQVLLG